MVPTSLLGKAKFSEALFSLARFVAFLSLSFPAARAGPWSGGPAERLRGQAEAAAVHPREPPSRVLAWPFIDASYPAVVRFGQAAL